MNETIHEFSRRLQIDPTWVPLLEGGLVIIIAILAYVATRHWLLGVVSRLIRLSSTKWDDLLLEAQLLNRLSALAPALVLYYGAYLLPGGSTDFVQRVITALMLLIALRLIGALLTAFLKIYSTIELESKIPIKGYVQIARILIYVLGGLVMVAILLGRDPWSLLTGIGAMTAVILLIFRDTILSLVASIQISAQKLVQEGDWIEAPAFGADGDVIDISLHTVKVQNWDKTITSIPTYKLLDASFRNWSGMTQSGGRRIKRAIHLDVNSVRFCDEVLLDRFSRFELLKPYLQTKLEEVRQANNDVEADMKELINGRRLTNVGTFRAYIVAYLRAHPQINQELTFLVRQLSPTPEGLPLEIYVFTNDTRWAVYEGIQADIFDHLFAVVTQFDLCVFQKPSGGDLTSLARS